MIGGIVRIAQGLRSIVTGYKQTNQTFSLNDIAKSSQVMPFVVIGEDCLHLEYLPHIMQSAQSMFCGIYLRALSLMSTIDNIRVSNVLNKVNPVFEEYSYKANIASFEGFNKQNNFSTAKDNWKLSAQSYNFRLPTSENELGKEQEILSIEANNPPTTNVKNNQPTLPAWASAQSTGNLSSSKTDPTVDKEGWKNIREVENLSVGKTVTARFKINEETIEVPIHFKLLINSLSDRIITNYLSSKKSEYNFAERFYDYKSGRIRFWQDLVFCNDIFKNQTKLLLEDKNNVIQQIMERANKNRANMFLNTLNEDKENQHVAGSSNIWVISELTASNIETKMGSRLKIQKTRDAVMDAGYAIMLIVIDKNDEFVTFYTRGIADASTMGVKDIKISNKGKGPDIGEILKAYQMGNSVQF